jgi:hypothetical protein
MHVTTLLLVLDVWRKMQTTTILQQQLMITHAFMVDVLLKVRVTMIQLQTPMTDLVNSLLALDVSVNPRVIMILQH